LPAIRMTASLTLEIFGPPPAAVSVDSLMKVNPFYYKLLR
jgi:hypothetical protein